MTGEIERSVILLGGSDTLREIDRTLRGHHVRVVRILTTVRQPVSPDEWWPHLARRPAPDTVIVTSRTGVTAGVGPWLRRERRARPREYWAVGPETARALARRKLGPVRGAGSNGAVAIAGKFRRLGHRGILRFRSDRAGPRLARTLRASGHSVTEAIVYRISAGPPFSAAERRAMAGADLVIATSPSALAHVRQLLGVAAFRRLARAARLVVLGERTLRAARGHGFRQVSVVPAVTGHRFTDYLLRELDHDPA